MTQFMKPYVLKINTGSSVSLKKWRKTNVEKNKG